MTTPENPKHAGLIRGLGFWAATAVVVGSMIGQAIFLVPGDVARELGSQRAVMLCWTIGGFVALCGILCYAELGAAMPEAGGAYVYLSRGLSPLWGFLYGWTSAMIMRPASAATIAAGLLRFATFLLPPLIIVLPYSSGTSGSRSNHNPTNSRLRSPNQWRLE